MNEIHIEMENWREKKNFFIVSLESLDRITLRMMNVLDLDFSSIITHHLIRIQKFFAIQIYYYTVWHKYTQLEVGEVFSLYLQQNILSLELTGQQFFPSL